MGAEALTALPAAGALKCQLTCVLPGALGAVTIAGWNVQAGVCTGVTLACVASADCALGPAPVLLAVGSAPDGAAGGASEMTCCPATEGGVGWVGLVMPLTSDALLRSTVLPSRLPVLTVRPPEVTDSTLPAWMPEARLPSTATPFVSWRLSPLSQPVSSTQWPYQLALSAMLLLSTLPAMRTVTLRPPVISAPLLVSVVPDRLTSRAAEITPAGPAAVVSSEAHWLSLYVPPALQPPA